MDFTEQDSVLTADGFGGLDQEFSGTTSAIPSYWGIDRKSSRYLGSLAPASRISLIALVVEKSGGTAPSLAINIVGASNKNCSNDRAIVATTGVIANADLTVGKAIRLLIPKGIPNAVPPSRYYRAEVVLHASNNSFVLRMWLKRRTRSRDSCKRLYMFKPLRFTTAIT